MKTRVCIVLIVSILTLFTIPAVQAATIVPAKYYLDPIHFYLVDTNNDGNVQIENTFSWLPDLNLNWRYERSVWSDWSPLSIMTFSNTDEFYTGVVYLRIVVNAIPDTDGYVTFGGGGIKGNNDWYRSLAIQWSEAPSVSFITVQPDDAVSPIPIASPALLLGSGVFGLMMVVTRKKR